MDKHACEIHGSINRQFMSVCVCSYWFSHVSYLCFVTSRMSNYWDIHNALTDGGIHVTLRGTSPLFKRDKRKRRTHHLQKVETRCQDDFKSVLNFLLMTRQDKSNFLLSTLDLRGKCCSTFFYTIFTLKINSACWGISRKWKKCCVTLITCD